MTAQRYVHDILQPHILPLMQRLPGTIFQEVNVRPLTARVSQDCLLMKEVETDQTIEEPAEIMHIYRDNESKYEKNDRHETFELI
ncbi:hypothetical protein TNCV_3820831 [Trichonephila clavipes]|nr:hypothetical protein TNCV_3820831 [Trichonephila clavipes]